MREEEPEKTYWQLLPRRNLIRAVALLVVLWAVIGAKRCTAPATVERAIAPFSPDGGVRVRMQAPITDAAAVD